ncbi:hypothetical protein HPB48_011978 [Haemaphysalis longicornis]|uniref:PID domain-containing protein n=1 Tax=Haemaphysalis longicornis TaxID=44386 RepID=A0A9J6H4U6_HAELO|nr:hypothetical protein HPB48_011978 [Haemaphysalis longicornis]
MDGHRGTVIIGINRRHGSSQQFTEKLSEEWTGIQQPVVEGITFYAKYLGSTLVEEPSGDKATADAIKTIIAMSNKPLFPCQNSTDYRQLRAEVADQILHGLEQLDFYTVYHGRISFCSADASFDRVVAFIGTHSNEVMECHAFLCAKRRVAQAAALTISQAFQVAYQAWQGSRQVTGSPGAQEADHGQKPAEANGNKEPDRKEEGRVTPLIDLSSETEMEAAFGRLGASPPLFSSGFKPQEEEELRRFVASGACSREAGLLDREDDLLSL